MIFVTVGTGKFNKLLESIDRHCHRNMDILMQIGGSEYQPRNFRYFRFKDSLEKEFKAADLIVSHGGAGTIFEVLSAGKKMIAVANLDRTDTHQEEILKMLSEKKYLLWCQDLENISSVIQQAEHFEFVKYEPPQSNIADKIEEFLEAEE